MTSAHLAGPRRLLTIAALSIIAAAPARAQGTDSSLTTLSGVYTKEQATKGQDVHGAACLSCHKPVEHTGNNFWSDRVNKPLANFFSYLKSAMPQDNPSSLSDDDYAAVIAFILQLNQMPAGSKPLPGDSTALSKIIVKLPAPPSTTATSSTGSKR